MPLSYICFNAVVPAKTAAIPYSKAFWLKYYFRSSNTSGLNSAFIQSLSPLWIIKDPNPAAAPQVDATMRAPIQIWTAPRTNPKTLLHQLFFFFSYGFFLI
jgi:hypothetical protein